VGGGGGEVFRPCPDRPWGPPSLLYNGYRVFAGGKVRSGRAPDHSPLSSAEVMEEYSYNSTHPLGHTRPVTGLLYLYLTTDRLPVPFPFCLIFSSGFATSSVIYFFLLISLNAWQVMEQQEYFKRYNISLQIFLMYYTTCSSVSTYRPALEPSLASSSIFCVWLCSARDINHASC
jgi:hypothetical protein